MKLHQIIAMVNGRKAKAQKMMTVLHRAWAPAALEGISRTYLPIKDDGLQFPPESKQIQVHVRDVIKEVRDVLIPAQDAIASQEYANTEAKASVKVDGKVLLADVPVGVLLFLEKQLEDLRTFALNIPTLRTDMEWKFDMNKNFYITDPVKTLKTSKEQVPITKYDATVEHPAQTEMITKDVPIGHWETTHFSGAIPATRKEEIVNNIEKLQEAVQVARAVANSHEIPELKNVGAPVLDFIFGSEKEAE